MRFYQFSFVVPVFMTALVVGCGGSSTGPVEMTARPAMTEEETKANDDYNRQQQEAADAYK